MVSWCYIYIYIYIFFLQDQISNVLFSMKDDFSYKYQESKQLYFKLEYKLNVLSAYNNFFLNYQGVRAEALITQVRTKTCNISFVLAVIRTGTSNIMVRVLSSRLMTLVAYNNFAEKKVTMIIFQYGMLSLVIKSFENTTPSSIIDLGLAFGYSIRIQVSSIWFRSLGFQRIMFYKFLVWFQVGSYWFRIDSIPDIIYL